MSRRTTAGRHFARQWTNLTKLTLNRCEQFQWADGSSLSCASQLSELYCDDSFFLLTSERESEALSEAANLDCYMFSWCRRVERFSIRNATCQVYAGDDEAQPVSQEMLIKMVRLHPTLRWLRSDLSPENIAMLKAERPDITFVSD